MRAGRSWRDNGAGIGITGIGGGRVGGAPGDPDTIILRTAPLGGSFKGKVLDPW